MNFLKGFLIAVTAFLLQSCFNSDDHLFDAAQAVDIKVETTLSNSMTDYSKIVKADTFNINDTIFFITTISPNKVIKVQDYQWLMDGKYCSSEYNFKKQITEPGYHKFTFMLKDYFGDMHYDSLEIWIAPSPTLNDSTFTPAEGTQAIDPYEAIYFTWSAKTEGIKLAHRYSFSLSEQSYANAKSTFTTIDTILTEPHFIYHNKLNPLKKYNWTVQAINEYGLISEEKIESFFFTKGLPGEGSFSSTIDIGNATAVPIHLSLQNTRNKDASIHYNLSVSKTNNEISLGSIPAGDYHLVVSSDYPDFKEIYKDICINEGFVTTARSIKLIDSIAPVIKAYSSHDTIAYADTLQFIVKDGGEAISLQNISVNLEGEPVVDKTYKDSILTVILKKTDQSWAYRILNISAMDRSQNSAKKSFYIMPSTFWFETNNDTTIANNESIDFFVIDHNPFDLKVDTIRFFNITQNKSIISIPGSKSNTYTANLEASLFEPEQTIQSTVIYKNGMQQSKNWTLTVTKATSKEEE
ncbi:hypothetical protein [Fibrobacter sp.]|uniref:hypothetical protein n=1 Tax=Fibrobacter sp. TaxID=35828 RepID=UPI0038659442